VVRGAAPDGRVLRQGCTNFLNLPPNSRQQKGGGMFHIEDHRFSRHGHLVPGVSANILHKMISCF
jgi:hypothetical protein